METTLTFEELEDGPIREQIGRTWNKMSLKEPFVKIGESKCFLPKEFAEHYENTIKKFQVLDDDVWIVTFAKAGTTWTQEMTWLLLNDLDYEGAKELLLKRSPYFEFDAFMCAVPLPPNGKHFWRVGPTGNALPSSMEAVEQLKSPRLIKSHLNFELLPDMLKNKSTKAKMIYVYRNPRDVCVSFYHWTRLANGYLGSLEEYVNEFIADAVLCAPFWDHVRKFVALKDDPQVLIISYEEMIKDLSSVVDKIASFLGKTINKEEKAVLLHHLHFDQMKVNKAVNLEILADLCVKNHGQAAETQFMRKGKVGSFKEELSPEAIEKLDRWVAQNKINGFLE